MSEIIQERLILFEKVFKKTHFRFIFGLLFHDVNSINQKAIAVKIANWLTKAIGYCVDSNKGQTLEPSALATLYGDRFP